MATLDLASQGPPMSFSIVAAPLYLLNSTHIFFFIEHISVAIFPPKHDYLNVLEMAKL